MSRLDELIKELCPDGVKFESLTTIFDTKNGYTPSKSNKSFWENGTVPWFRMEDIRENGHILSKAMQYVTKSAVKGNPFPANSFIIATSATIGEHALITVPSLANQRFTYLVLKDAYKEKFNIKFLFYYCFKLDEYCKQYLNQSNFASVDMKKFEKFSFPILPLEIQDKIVRILDSFTEYIALLEKELELRKKQYAYYRDQLLSFAHLKTTVLEQWTIGEVAIVSRGIRVVKKQLETTGNIPVYQNSIIPLGYHKKSNCPKNTAFIIGAGAAGEIGFSYVDFWAADDCYYFICSEKILNKYIYYILLSKSDFIKSKVRKASIPRLARSVIEKLLIPVPPIKEQERIVAILDRFDRLCNDLTNGLPAEITARQKQYEYYRDRLLNFKKLN
ncbi:MAG: restriction endonuclease subunit S [Oscillospiraceae bacterium]|nr:restriction endonuclease subunit S [Oscillospiraceae bacterium]